MKDAACTAIYGRRGSGKTTLTRKLIGGHDRLVVFDPMREFAKDRSFVRCDRIADVLNAMRRSWSSGFRLAYVPTADHTRMLHGLAELVWHAQLPYDEGRDRRKLMLVVDEMSMGYPNEKMARKLYAMQRAVLQGRHRGIEIIGVTQRPALISMDFRGNVADTFVFPLSGSTDIQAVCQVYGPEHAGAIRDLTDHTYIRFAEGGLKTGRNARLK